jgi:hypothetical protein
VDRVLPWVPVRQWVLSLPFALRYRLAYDARLTSEVLRIFLRCVFASLRRRARPREIRWPQCGARRDNEWGATTGRHINEMGLRDWPVLDLDEFTALQNGVAQLKTNIRPGSLQKLGGLNGSLQHQP